MKTGLLNYIGLGKESSFGSETAPSVYLPIKPSDGIQPNVDVKEIGAIRGSLPKNKDLHKGLVVYEGSFSMDLYPVGIGHIILSALGNVSSGLKSGETDVYEHNFSEQESKQSYTVEQKIGEIVKRVLGFTVKKFSVEGVAGETIGFNFEGIGKTSVDASEGSPSYEDNRAFNFSDVVYIKIGGTDITQYVREFSVEYDNGIEPVYAVGDNLLKGVYVNEGSVVGGKLSLYVDDNTKNYLDSVINLDKDLSFEVDIKGDSIGSNSNYEVKITVPKCAFTTVSAKLDVGANMMELEFTAIEDASNGIIAVYLVNQQSGY